MRVMDLILAFPIYLLVMRLILRETADHPERLESGVRKWLTYLALLGTAGAMICDLIWFLDYFLTGELTVRFVLKSATIMLISGAVFAYYQQRAKARNIVFGAAATLTVIVTFCIGLGVAGTPSRQRQMEADRKRVDDLRNIGNAIKLWHEKTGAIPAALGDLNSRMTDPETGAAYEYHPKTGTAYELCANFHSDEGRDRRAAYPSNLWEHGSGRSCFTLDASKPVPY